VFLVEDISTRYFLEGFLQNHYNDKFVYHIINFQGKQDMLGRLGSYLKGYSSWADDTFRYIILIDRDADDCMELKSRLEYIVSNHGFISRRASNVNYKVITWIAIEELEAWYIGDFAALRSAFPRIPDRSQRAKYRNPDSISGGTWESLEKELKSVGYYGSGLLKIDLAKKMANCIKPLGNRSKSFNGFVRRLNDLHTDTQDN
jgi:hypothetical protein